MTGPPFTEREAALWLEWVEDRPPEVRDVVERLPPWHTYRLKTTGQHCRIQSYDEDEDTGVCTLRIWAWYPWMGQFLGRGVFGVDPDSLELPFPAKNEPTA